MKCSPILPLAWVGDHYLNYAQGYVAGFCIACPEGAERVANDLREIGPTYHFAHAAAHVRGAVDAGADPHGGRERSQALAVSRFHDGGQTLGRTYRQRRAGADGCPTGLSPRRSPDLRPAQERARILARSRRLHRGEAIEATDLFAFYRSIGLNLKQLYGQTEAFLFVTAQSDRAVRSDAVGPPAPNVELRITESGEVQFKSPGMFVGYFREDDKTRETTDGRRLRQDGRRRLLRSGRPAQYNRPCQGRRPPPQWADVRSQVH